MPSPWPGPVRRPLPHLLPEAPGAKAGATPLFSRSGRSASLGVTRSHCPSWEALPHPAHCVLTSRPRFPSRSCPGTQPPNPHRLQTPVPLLQPPHSLGGGSHPLYTGAWCSVLLGSPQSEVPVSCSAPLTHLSLSKGKMASGSLLIFLFSPNRTHFPSPTSASYRTFFLAPEWP